ncbi:MAG TPA: hypothetical protein G4O11_12980 [Anaerolineae bacterium]|nr:hypothetical protein [Anaerolineae bacterium]
MDFSRTRMMLLSLILLSLACGLPGLSPTPDDSELATSVAATLTAETPPQPHGTISEQTQSPLVSTLTSTTPPPSVLRIVYTDDGNVWLIEDSNPPIQLTSSGDANQVLISSDGMKVAFVRRTSPDNPVEIGSVNIDGSGELTLFGPAQFDTLYPLDDYLHHDLSSLAFVPGTHHLMFNTRAVPEGPGLIKHDDLLLLDADTGVFRTIFSPGSGGDFTLSPDGNQIAITKPTGISLANIDGSNMRSNLITYAQVITYSEFNYYPLPVWSPDSSAIGVVIPSPDPFDTPTSGAIWRVQAEGGAKVNLGTILGDFYFTQTSYSLMSPMLDRVAYLSETPTPNIYDLFLATADGSGETLYASGDIQWHGWAPDNIHFVFAMGSPLDLHLGRSGSAPLPLCSGLNLRWIDDVNFLCLSGAFGSWTLMKGEIGGTVTPLASPLGDFVSYDFDD